MRDKRHFTPAENDLIRQHYPQGGSPLCATFMPRTLAAISTRAHRLGVRYEGQRDTHAKMAAATHFSVTRRWNNATRNLGR